MVPRDCVEESHMAVLAVTQSVSRSLEATILVCVAQSEPTSMVAPMGLRPTMIEEPPQLTEPMLLVSVSHMALLENTSGPLLLELLSRDQRGEMPVLVMLLLTLESHHLWVETTSVSQEITLQHLTESFAKMTHSGMAVDVISEVTVARSTILHTSLRGSPTLPLMILRPDCVGWIVAMTLQ